MSSNLVTHPRLERGTPWLKVRCSANWASESWIGSPSRTRTYDRSVNSRLLYRLSYRGILERETRFELATPALARRCSTAELFPRTWCLRTESNCRHMDFQSIALPTELPRHEWRPRSDLNWRSSPWQGDMLTATPRGRVFNSRWLLVYNNMISTLIASTFFKIFETFFISYVLNKKVIYFTL